MCAAIPAIAPASRLALCVAAVLSVGPATALAQYSTNPVLRNPGATTPVPRRANPPPATYEPAPQPPPAIRQNDPFPNCVSAPCNAPPIIRKPRPGG